MSATSSFRDGEQVRNPLFVVYFQCESQELLGDSSRIVADRLGLKPFEEALAELLACGPSVALRQFVIAVLIRARDTVEVQPRHILRLAQDMPDPQPGRHKLASDLIGLLLDRERYSSRQARYVAAMERMTGCSFEGSGVTRGAATLDNDSGIEMLPATGS